MARIKSIASVLPGLQEGHTLSPVGIQRMVSVPIGPPKLVDSATYKHALFIAPCNGCQIKEIWVSAAVAIAGGTNTLAFENYDASANSGSNVLSATNWDPTGVTAKEGSKMTLSSTESYLYMDEGDVLWGTLVCGSMTTDGEGYVVMSIVVVPEIV